MTELKQIVICDNCGHAVDKLGTNSCSVCSCPLLGSQDQSSDQFEQSVKKFIMRFGEAWEELAKK